MAGMITIRLCRRGDGAASKKARDASAFGLMMMV